MKIHQKLNLRYYKKSAKIWRQIFFADYFFQCSKNILNFLCCLKSETNKNLEIIVQNIDNSGFFFYSLCKVYIFDRDEEYRYAFAAAEREEEAENADIQVVNIISEPDIFLKIKHLFKQIFPWYVRMFYFEMLKMKTSV